MTFTESDICFRFGPQWVVCRYDTHRYYRGWSGVGLKGVDFIGILEEETLVVMEVKNFRIRPAGNRGHTLDALLAHPGKLTEAFGNKIADTFTAIDAVRRYVQRRWWRRLALRWWHSRRSPRSSEAAFWARICALAENPDKCIAVLWLESEALDSGFRTRIGNQLSEELADISRRVYVVDTRSNPFAESLEAG